jgi:quercetin dioxygenase-like cupin family protein
MIKVTRILPEFSDERGYISRIIDQDTYKIRSVLYISRKKGSIGANHYHKKDAHYIFVLKGKVRYGEKNMKKKDSKIEFVILEPGDVVLSKPGIGHITEFLTDSIILAFTTENRNQKSYEKDTVRLNLE